MFPAGHVGRIIIEGRAYRIAGVCLLHWEIRLSIDHSQKLRLLIGAAKSTFVCNNSCSGRLARKTGEADGFSVRVGLALSAASDVICEDWGETLHSVIGLFCYGNLRWRTGNCITNRIEWYVQKTKWLEEIKTQYVLSRIYNVGLSRCNLILNFDCYR